MAVDPVYEKLVASRRKSIEKLQVEVDDLHARIESAPRLGELRNLLVATFKIKDARLQKLKGELKAVEAVYQQLPGTEGPGVSPGQGGSKTPPGKR